MLHRTLLLCLLLLTDSHAPAAEAWSPYKLATFPAASDASLSNCQSIATEARENEERVCKNPYRTCEQALSVWLTAIKQCEKGLKTSKETAAFLYYLGLIHSGLNLKVQKESQCPAHLRYQEGSSVCVYRNTHYDRVLAEFPKTRYADMAAFNKAEQTYKYYECEGSMFCNTENRIHGWVMLLKDRAKAPFEDVVVSKIERAFEELATMPIDIEHEDPRGLEEELETLKLAMKQMSEGGRQRIDEALARIHRLIGSFRAPASGDTQVPGDFSVKLARGTCEGSCPAYSFSLDSKGNVIWDGRYFVEQKGPARKVISQIDLQSIVRKVEGMKFFGFRSGARQCLDTPDILIEITVNRKTKSVSHDSCSQAQTSEGQQIAELARYLENIIGTEQWVGQKRPSPAP